jgi:hypothetical protein
MHKVFNLQYGCFFISIIMFGIYGSNVCGAESFIILSKGRARIGVAVTP